MINCLYYNPPLTLHILEERNLTQAFFSIWFDNINRFSRVHDKKLVVVTLCSLMEIPVEQLPSILQAGWPQVLEVILTIFNSLPKAEEGKVLKIIYFEYIVLIYYEYFQNYLIIY